MRMKIEKGRAGYITVRKKKYLMFTLLEFALVAALLILGYTQTGTKMNLLTVVAVVGCLPACKMLVGLLVMIPFRTIDEKKYKEVEENASLLTNVYDIILTCKQKLILVDAVVILDHTVCGYTSMDSADLNGVAEHIKDMLRENQLNKITVKIFRDYASFLSRAEGMNNMASVNRPETWEAEQRIKTIILNISM